MKRFKDEPVKIGRRSATPIHQQVYDRIRTAIAEGRLVPGERLPSTRSLAVQLGVSRGTVEVAYARGMMENWISTSGESLVP